MFRYETLYFCAGFVLHTDQMCGGSPDSIVYAADNDALAAALLDLNGATITLEDECIRYGLLEKCMCLYDWFCCRRKWLTEPIEPLGTLPFISPAGQAAVVFEFKCCASIDELHNASYVKQVKLNAAFLGAKHAMLVVLCNNQLGFAYFGADDITSAVTWLNIELTSLRSAVREHLSSGNFFCKDIEDEEPASTSGCSVRRLVIDISTCKSMYSRVVAAASAYRSEQGACVCAFACDETTCCLASVATEQRAFKKDWRCRARVTPARSHWRARSHCGSVSGDPAACHCRCARRCARHTRA